MGKITVTRAYHIGMPVNDIKRAEKFYVDVLGMNVKGRGAGERESNRPIERDWKEDSFCHTAFSTSKEDFDLALEKMKEWGVKVHLGPIAYRGGRTLYFFDSEGNFLQLGDRG